jgi:hypothetical protein
LDRQSASGSTYPIKAPIAFTRRHGVNLKSNYQSHRV